MSAEELWRVHLAEELERECENYRKYLRLLDGFLTEELERFRKQNDGRTGDDVALERWRIGSIFPTTLLHGTLCSIFSYGEIKMRALCQSDARMRGLVRTTRDEREVEEALREKDGVKKYWTRVGLKHANTPEWTEIMNVRDVRNQIMHVGEFREETDRWERIEAYEKKRYKTGVNGFGLMWGTTICFGSEYCEEVIDLFHRFLSMQLQAIPTHFAARDAT